MSNEVRNGHDPRIVEKVALIGGIGMGSVMSEATGFPLIATLQVGEDKVTRVLQQVERKIVEPVPDRQTDYSAQPIEPYLAPTVSLTEAGGALALPIVGAVLFWAGASKLRRSPGANRQADLRRTA